MKRRIIIPSVAALAVTAAAVVASHPGTATADGPLGGVTTAAGVGESLLLVVAAQAPSRAEAEQAAAGINVHFGELQGFSVDDAGAYELTGGYVDDTPPPAEVDCPASGAVFETVVASVPVDLDCPEGMSSVQVLQPVSLRSVPNPGYALEPGSSIVVTAFRTKRGAEEFLELARSAGVDGLVVVAARKLGGGDVGLGQEPHPDGSGPLTGPLANQESYQR